MQVRRIVPVGLLLLAAGSAAQAASPGVADLSGALHWRLLGPFRAGRVLAVSGVPGEPDHFYFGSVNGGVWESRNAGRTWRPIFDDQPIGSIGALAVAPSDPRVLYAGTGEADMRSDIAQGDGVYRSRDGGATWTHVGLADSQQIARILVDPGDPRTVFVAALGHPYGPNEERGVFRSRDGGEHWTRVLGEGADTGAVDLAFDPGNPRAIYAALWQTRRTPWSVYPPSNGPGSGLYKSTDGGDSWTDIGGDGFPERPGRIGVAVAPSDPRRVYAIVDADDGGLYRSDDGGGHWRRVSADERIWGRGWYFGAVTVDPRDADVIYVPNINLYRSDDGGATFAPVKGAPGGDDYHQLWIDPAHPERRILGVDQGATVSVDGGATWGSWYNQPTGQFYHVTTDGRFPYWVYGAQQDSGAAAIPSRTNSYDGINITRFRETTAGGESDYIAPDPRDPEVIYGGRVDRLDLRTEQTHAVPPPLAYPDLYRRTWTLPLVFSRRDPRVLYFANQKVFRTVDGGEHWEVISPDLTRPDPGVPANLDPVTAALTTGPRPGVVYALAPSRLTDGELWAGTDDGLIWRTRDEGAHWQDVTPAGLTPWSKVGIIETSHFDADTAYAAVDRHRLDDFRPYAYRTHDGGAHWQLAAAGIPDGSFVNVVREDPVRRGLLYAGTEKGVYVSRDDGDHWESLQLDLPVTSVRDIDVHGDDLVIATHGRAFWILDDVSPLRRLDEVPAGSAAWLFRPAPAVRLRPAGFTGTPMPQDEPLAANPPGGAYLDYFLRADASAAVTLEIRDEAGGLVRSYSSAVAPPVPDPARLRTAPEWFRVPATLSTRAGLHRFVWPLRTAAPPALTRGNAYGDGVWVPPGRYVAALTVDGERLEQPLEVVPDPRVTVSAEDYAEQYALALRVETQRATIAAAAREAEALTKALVARRPGAGAYLRPAMDALLERTLELWGLPLSSNPSNSWWMPPSSTATLRFLGGALNDLAEAVDGADGAPSPDARAGAAQLAPLVRKAAAAWEGLKAGDLAALDARLEAAGQPPLSLSP